VDLIVDAPADAGLTLPPGVLALIREGVSDRDPDPATLIFMLLLKRLRLLGVRVVPVPVPVPVILEREGAGVGSADSMGSVRRNSWNIVMSPGEIDAAPCRVRI
jgi:hypothetical protein